MSEERFFEKFYRWAVSDSSSLINKKFNLEKLTSSITKHISFILNTRQGSVLIDKEYGLPESHELIEDFSEDKKEELASQIKIILEKFEPRIKEVSLNYNEIDTTCLAFTIKAKECVTGQGNELNFTTVMASRGKFIVKI